MKPGTIEIDFRKPIKPGLGKDEFLKLLDREINTLNPLQ